MRGLKFRGRPPIKIADSVKSVVNLDNPYAAAIMDRGTVIDQGFVDAIMAQSVFGWEGRNPAPALDEDGNFQCTDLDLLSFLFPMVERGAVIEFPHYKSHRASVARANERRIGTPSRFGPLTNMTSNQKFFSFSVRMVDSSVVITDPATGREKVGAFRNFMLVGPDGIWHPGWKQIVFSPTAKENKFLTEKDLWTGNTVYFKNAVHPNRWQSVFGAPYLLLKMLIERLSDEAKHYSEVMKDLKAQGATLPEGEIAEAGPSEPSGVMQEKVKIEGLEAIIDLPSLVGSYPALSKVGDDLNAKNAALLAAHRRVKAIRYTLKPAAQTIVRADELAFYLHGNGRVASWLSSRQFRDFTPPRARTTWQQIVLSNEVAYRYRLREVTDTVAVEFAA
ncbi:hypothetical protein HYT05_04185 [Candidatus Kaiserbacteria bacterium]|nr:hypothetical protein [Candidatus Kaiserbacteria bacterium]